jgi:hypothetical protein
MQVKDSNLSFLSQFFPSSFCTDLNNWVTTNLSGQRELSRCNELYSIHLCGWPFSNVYWTLESVCIIKQTSYFNVGIIGFLSATVRELSCSVFHLNIRAG